MPSADAFTPRLRMRPPQRLAVRTGFVFFVTLAGRLPTAHGLPYAVSVLPSRCRRCQASLLGNDACTAATLPSRQRAAYAAVARRRQAAGYSLLERLLPMPAMRHAARQAIAAATAARF